MKIFPLIIAGLILMGATGCAQRADRVPVYHYGSGVGGGSLGIHTLKKGETLWAVANAYHIDLRDLLDKNNLTAPYRIQAGQRLKIPAPLTYKTKQGDTLYKVSRMFDTTTTELAQLNHLRAPFVVTRNQTIRIPRKRAAQTVPVIQHRPIPQVTPIEREELKPVGTHRVSPPPPAISGKGFIKPVAGKIISGFGPKADGLHNDGINIQATRGSAVRAADTGIVVHSGNEIEGYGNMVLVRHANGYLTAYAHMDKSLVKKGDKVTRGETIGTVGSTGNVKTPQLHFEIRKGREAINPQTFI